MATSKNQNSQQTQINDDKKGMGSMNDRRNRESSGNNSRKSSGNSTNKSHK